jgi:D-alanine-D-alanine ligase
MRRNSSKPVLLPPFNLVQRLQQYKPYLCFNIAEGHFGDGRESQIPSILEMLRIPYTGSKVMTLALALDKPMTKRILTYHGLPTAEFQVFEQADEPMDDDLLDQQGELKFPLFVEAEPRASVA